MNTYGTRLFGKIDGFDGTAKALFQSSNQVNNVKLFNVVGEEHLFAGNPANTQTEAGTEIDSKLIYKVALMKYLRLVANYAC